MISKPIKFEIGSPKAGLHSRKILHNLIKIGNINLRPIQSIPFNILKW